MSTQYLNRPGYVIAILLAVIALEDAAYGLINMQTPACNSLLLPNQPGCPGNTGWLVDLGAAVVSAGLLAAVLLRPQLPVFAAILGWSVVAFVANRAYKNSATGVDAVATLRMTIYLVTASVAAIPLIAAWLTLLSSPAPQPTAPVAEAPERPAPPAPTPPAS